MLPRPPPRPSARIRALPRCWPGRRGSSGSAARRPSPASADPGPPAERTRGASAGLRNRASRREDCAERPRRRPAKRRSDRCRGAREAGSPRRLTSSNSCCSAPVSTTSPRVSRLAASSIRTASRTLVFSRAPSTVNEPATTRSAPSRSRSRARASPPSSSLPPRARSTPARATVSPAMARSPGVVRISEATISASATESQSNSARCARLRNGTTATARRSTPERPANGEARLRRTRITACDTAKTRRERNRREEPDLAPALSSPGCRLRIRCPARRRRVARQPVAVRAPVETASPSSAAFASCRLAKRSPGCRARQRPMTSTQRCRARAEARRPTAAPGSGA